MKITWKLLCDIAEVAGLTITNVGPSLYNIYKGSGNLLYIGNARECYAYMRGWQKKGLTDGTP